MSFNELIQWIGAGFIILGHLSNAIGPRTYPYNIVVFTLGTISFLIWSLRVDNLPQLVVNIVALTICISGLIKAYRVKYRHNTGE